MDFSLTHVVNKNRTVIERSDVRVITYFGTDN